MKRLLIILWLVVTTSLYAYSQVYYIREGGTSYGKIKYYIDRR